MREEVAPSESQRMVIEMTLKDLDCAQADLNEFCRRGGIAPITLEAAQNAVVIHKAKVAMALQLFGFNDTNELREKLGISAGPGSSYVPRNIC